MLIFMTILTGIIYPLTFTTLTKLFLYKKSSGDFVEVYGKIVGAKLIAQKFSSDKYFWPRPSACDYDALHSGASNLGPTSLELKNKINERASYLARRHLVDIKQVPTELIYASGSGLDPHISLEAAYFQLDRVAGARSVDKQKIKKMIDDLAERNVVNVLNLNIKMDQT